MAEEGSEDDAREGGEVAKMVAMAAAAVKVVKGCLEGGMERRSFGGEG